MPLLMLLFTGYGRVLARSTTKFPPGCCSRKAWTPETFFEGSIFTCLHTHVSYVMFNWRKHSCTYSGIVNVLQTAGRLLPPTSSEEISFIHETELAKQEISKPFSMEIIIFGRFLIKRIEVFLVGRETSKRITL
ncbi:hypothetical protein D1007_40518 [Hordeum vulgare]|nr:hypothetical protein D1007_40518 [Hordeum vulgare]